MLINQVNLDLWSSLDGLSDDAINKRVKEEAKAKLQEICIEPLKQLAGLDIPHAIVSSGHRHFEYLVRA
jgi:hypothetical protein